MDDTLEVVIARIETKLDTLLTQGGDHEKRLRRLEGHGGKRWENLVNQVITLIVAGAIGVFIGKLL